MILYHFTSTEHLPRILRAGYLKTVESNIDRYQEHAGPDVVWLLDTPTVEFDHGLTHASAVDSNGVRIPLDKSGIRFTVDVPAIRWLDWPPAAKMTLEWRRRMMEVAGGEEAATHWYVYPRPIAAKRWIEIRDMKKDQEMVYTFTAS